MDTQHLEKQRWHGDKGLFPSQRRDYDDDDDDDDDDRPHMPF